MDVGKGTEDDEEVVLFILSQSVLVQLGIDS